MMDLTEKILSLDLETASELNSANALSMEIKREADIRAEQQIQEVQQLFEKEKNSEAKQLAKTLKEDRGKAIDHLHQKMETFDKDIDIDVLVEHLLTVAKDRICP